MVFVLLVGGGTDAADRAGLQRGLEQVRGIHGAAAGGPGSDDGMHFVDEQDGLVFFLDGGHHLFQPFFKVAPILGACDQGAKVEHVDLRILQQVGNQFFRIGVEFLAGNASS
jgi:hypothetical protein